MYIFLTMWYHFEDRGIYLYFSDDSDLSKEKTLYNINPYALNPIHVKCKSEIKVWSKYTKTEKKVIFTSTLCDTKIKHLNFKMPLRKNNSRIKKIIFWVN